MPDVFPEIEQSLFLIRHFEAATPQIKEPFSPGTRTLQIVMQFVVHEAPLPPNFDKTRVLHNLQMMGDSDDFRIQQVRDVTDGQLPIP